MTDAAFRKALDKAAQSWCCGLAACHYEDCGLPCQMRDHPRMGAAIATFIRACPLVSDQPPGMDRMGFFDENARERWAAAIDRAAGGGA